MGLKSTVGEVFAKPLHVVFVANWLVGGVLQGFWFYKILKVGLRILMDNGKNKGAAKTEKAK